jgi:hypothetical protein
MRTRVGHGLAAVLALAGHVVGVIGLPLPSTDRVVVQASRLQSAGETTQQAGSPAPQLAARNGFARFAAATAAAVLLAINLSVSVANDTDWRLRPSPLGPDVADLTEQIRTLAPDVPDGEARRQALLLRAGATLVPAPVPHPPADRTFWNKEPDRWATH